MLEVHKEWHGISNFAALEKTALRNENHFASLQNDKYFASSTKHLFAVLSFGKAPKTISFEEDCFTNLYEESPSQVQG